jgi:DNA-binding winged helix-turn-helix (wHTH) protein
VPAPQHFTFGPFRLDAETGELTAGANVVKLTPKTTAVLRLLGERAGELVGKRELFAKVWAGRVVSDAALTSCIQELRRALGDDPRRPKYLETLHRRGYRLLVPLVRGGHAADVMAAPPNEIVGRRRELAELEAAMTRARSGSRQIVFVAGEAGIGKTALIDAFVAAAVRDTGLLHASGRCTEHYGSSEPYLPLLDALTSAARGPHGEDVLEALRRRAPSWLAQLPGLLDDVELERLVRRSAGATRERMLRELADAVEGICAARPLLLRLEDLHWSDASTLDWLGFVARRPQAARLLIVASIRSDESLPRDHPLAALRAELPLRAACRIVELPPLTPDDVAEYLGRRFAPAASGTLPGIDSLAATIHGRTEGNPLFVVTVTNDLVARGALQQVADNWVLRSAERDIAAAVPGDLRRVIELLLDRQSDRERTVLEAASAVGREFSAAAVAAALRDETQAVEAVCAALARRGQLLDVAGAQSWPDGTLASGYSFRHELYRAALYDRLPTATRAQWHARIGDRLEAAFGPHARERSAELAAHFERGRDVPRAVLHHHAAGDNASRRNAPREAIDHYRRALELLAELPDSHQRALREIELNIALGPALLASQGWGAAEAERAYSRAQQLSARTGATREMFTALWGLWVYRWGQDRLDDAQALGEQLLALAERTSDDSLHLQAHHALWATCLPRGQILACVEHAIAGEGVYVAERHGGLAARFGNHDACACAAQFRAWALALHGDAQQSRALAERALAMTKEHDHPFGRALSLFFAGALHQILREPELAERHARAAVDVAAEQGFKLIEAWSSAVVGWSVAMRGDETGPERIVAAIAAARATGTLQFQTLFYAILADACLRARRTNDGLAAAAQGLEIAQRTGERFCEAELLRLDGELALAAAAAAPPPGAAALRERSRKSLERSLESARAQAAHLLEVRCAVSLLRAGVAPNDGAAELRSAVARLGADAACVDAGEARDALAAVDATGRAGPR